MKIAVFGTPQLSADIFEKLFQVSQVEVVSVVTAPDKPAGRGKKMTHSPVKIWSESHKIPVFQPKKSSIELAKNLTERGVEVCVVIAYGYIFSKEFLDSAPPAWNLHFSLLPKFRGASPVPSAILAGEEISGITVFRITAGMDDGPVLGQQEVNISGKKANTVFGDMTIKGFNLLRELLLQKVEMSELPELQQDHVKMSRCGKIIKSDGFIKPKQETAEFALRKIRAYYPWPGTSVEYKERRLKIIDAKIADISLKPNTFLFEKTGIFLGFSSGALELLEVQIEGKKPVSGAEFGRGQL